MAQCAEKHRKITIGDSFGLRYLVTLWQKGSDSFCCELNLTQQVLRYLKLNFRELVHE
jgi:hypothetical protein